MESKRLLAQGDHLENIARMRSNRTLSWQQQQYRDMQQDPKNNAEQGLPASTIPHDDIATSAERDRPAPVMPLSSEVLGASVRTPMHNYDEESMREASVGFTDRAACIPWNSIGMTSLSTEGASAPSGDTSCLDDSWCAHHATPAAYTGIIDTHSASVSANMPRTDMSERYAKKVVTTRSPYVKSSASPSPPPQVSVALAPSSWVSVYVCMHCVHLCATSKSVHDM